MFCSYGFNFSFFFTFDDSFDYGCSIMFMLNNFSFLTRMCLYWSICIRDGVAVDEIIPKSKYALKKRVLKGLNVFVEEEINRIYNVKERHCGICKTIKPERAFHCTICNKCFLKFDHHNSLFNICIGFHNYKAFIQLIVLGVCTYLMVEILFGIHLSYSIWKPNYLIPTLITMTIFSLLLLYFIYLSLLFIPLLLRNETYNEYVALNKFLYEDGVISDALNIDVQLLTGKEDRYDLNPYNISIIENLKSVFGYTYLCVLSLSFSPGDGMSFKKKSDELEKVLFN